MTVLAAKMSAGMLEKEDSFKNFLALIMANNEPLDKLFGQTDLQLQRNWIVVLRGPLEELTGGLDALKDRQISSAGELGIYLCHADGMYNVVVRETVTRQKFVTSRIYVRDVLYRAKLKLQDIIDALNISVELERGGKKPIRIERGYNPTATPLREKPSFICKK